MGDSGPAHQVGSISNDADDLHTRDCPITWSVSIHSIGQGSKVHGKLLEEFPQGHGDVVDNEYYVSSIEKWSIKEDHTCFRGHVASMCLGF